MAHTVALRKFKNTEHILTPEFPDFLQLTQVFDIDSRRDPVVSVIRLPPT